MNICKKCGNEHGMVLEEMSTGKTEPIDYCKECLFPPIQYDLKEKVLLKNDFDMTIEEMKLKLNLENLMIETQKNILNKI